MYKDTNMHTYLPSYTDTYWKTGKHYHLQSYTCTYRHTYTHANMYTNIYIYKYTHMPICTNVFTSSFRKGRDLLQTCPVLPMKVQGRSLPFPSPSYRAGEGLKKVSARPWLYLKDWGRALQAFSSCFLKSFLESYESATAFSAVLSVKYTFNYLTIPRVELRCTEGSD